MKCAVKINDLLGILAKRPALVKKLVNPSNEVLIKILNKNTSTYQYFTDTQKNDIINAHVVNKYLHDQVYVHSRELLYWVPASYLATLPLETHTEILLQRIDNFRVYVTNKQMSKDLLLSVVQKLDARSLELVPDIVDDDVLYAYFNKNDTYRGSQLNGAVLDKITVPLLKKIITETKWGWYNIIYGVPPYKMTDELYPLILDKIQENPDTHVTSWGWLPEAYWTDDIAMIALSRNGDVREIPKKYVTKDICLELIKRQPSCICILPDSLKGDIDIGLVALKQGYVNYEIKSSIESNVDNMMKIAALGCRAMEALCKTFYISQSNSYLKLTEEQMGSIWEEAVKSDYQCIKLIPKPQQTRAIVKAFIMSCPQDKMDEMVTYLNKQYISKDLAPLLINVPSLHDLVKGKLDPANRAVSSSVSVQSDEVLMDLNDKDRDVLA